MDPGKLLIWNVRGLNASVRQDSIKELVDSSQVDVVCLQETKMQNISRRNILSMLGADFPEYVYLPSVGASGGILIAWRRHIGHTGQTNFIITVFRSSSVGQRGRPGGLLVCMDLRVRGKKFSSSRNLETSEMHVMVLGWWLGTLISSTALRIRTIPILIGQ
jgi:endonuclease/exonuclease/phosphatase family metal-dependent hydrolase